jgi:hypothetical protein
MDFLTVWQASRTEKAIFVDIAVLGCLNLRQRRLSAQIRSGTAPAAKRCS